MKLSSHRVRLNAPWILILPFLWLARPTPLALSIGGALGLVGLLVRASAAGYIHKERILATGGPYAHTRNPLYLGSFLLGMGVAVAGGHWVWPLLFLVFFVLVYRQTIRAEAEKLEVLFGDAYLGYARHVPLFWPRLRPYRSLAAPPRGFSWARYRRNREYEAALGAVLGFAALTLNMVLR